MLNDYESEIESWQTRMAKLEAAENDRLTSEIEYQEELLSNAGKPRNYFQTPAFLEKRRKKR